MVERAYRVCQDGFQNVGIVEVSIGGTQLGKISASLQERFKDYSGDPVQLNLYILKQALSKNRGEAISKKGYSPVHVNNDVTLVFHIVETPFLMGEDVDQYLCYDFHNQHPVNLILPDGTLWQLRSPEGTRRTLKNVMSGSYNGLVTSLYESRPVQGALSFSLCQSGSLYSQGAERTKTGGGLGRGAAFNFILEKGWDPIPIRVGRSPDLTEQFLTFRGELASLQDWSLSIVRQLHQKYGHLPSSQYMKACLGELSRQPFKSWKTYYP